MFGIELSQTLGATECVDFPPFPDNVDLARRHQQIAGVKIDEQQATARIRHKVPSVLLWLFPE